MLAIVSPLSFNHMAFGILSVENGGRNLLDGNGSGRLMEAAHMTKLFTMKLAL
jgi:hypothetical protein